ncbi:hypothetical protein H5202_21725 [Shewanella sp. SG41-4]|uniref:hypothetical protein n=1 Tax=Shewanella sp. SG41-4 TaxID=2760976 RepID=UPI0016043C25|nr:hypothetical protein [Shewanella sp. SG41-4]MBB1441202.1 hypothetical protein [Shewanella sp. SG41-4]
MNKEQKHHIEVTMVHGKSFKFILNKQKEIMKTQERLESLLQEFVAMIPQSLWEAEVTKDSRLDASSPKK